MRLHLPLMLSAYLQDARMVDLARPGKDPHPVLLTYKPLLEVLKRMAADAKAAGKDGSGFVLKPVIKRVVEMRRVDPSDPNSPMEQVEIRQYDHPSTGTWWNKAQEEVRILESKWVGVALQLCMCFLNLTLTTSQMTSSSESGHWSAYQTLPVGMSTAGARYIKQR